MSMTMPVEEDLLRTLRTIAEHNKGVFPAKLGMSKEVMEALMELVKPEMRKLEAKYGDQTEARRATSGCDDGRSHEDPDAVDAKRDARHHVLHNAQAGERCALRRQRRKVGHAAIGRSSGTSPAAPRNTASSTPTSPSKS